MVKKKFKGAYFLVVLLAFLAIIAAVGAVTMLGGGIMDENGEPFEDGAVALITALFSLAFVSYVCALFVVLKQLIKYRGLEFTADADGIHNIAVVVNILAFFVSAHIKLIPWSAVTVKEDEPNTYILFLKIDAEQAKASAFGKIILRFFGVRIEKKTLTAEEEKTILRYIRNKRW